MRFGRAQSLAAQADGWETRVWSLDGESRVIWVSLSKTKLEGAELEAEFAKGEQRLTDRINGVFHLGDLVVPAARLNPRRIYALDRNARTATLSDDTTWGFDDLEFAS